MGSNPILAALTSSDEAAAFVARADAGCGQERRRGAPPGSVYFKALCTCGKRHAKWSIHLTPSNSNYAKDLHAWFRRQECW